jgi:hypothetical protein
MIGIQVADLALPKECYEMLVWMKTDEFQKTGNPVLAIEAILLANMKQIAWPQALAMVVNTWFQQWHDNQGTVSLDKIIGLKLSNGKTPPYKALLLRDRNEMLFMRVAVLRALDVKILLASEITCRGFEKFKDWNKSKWKLPPIDTDMLFKEYFKWPARKEMEAFCKQSVRQWSPKQMHGFLSQFPTDSLPPKLKKILGKLFHYLKENESKWRRVDGRSFKSVV